MGAHPFSWGSEIYGFHGDVGPQRVLSPPRTKLNEAPPGQIPECAPAKEILKIIFPSSTIYSILLLIRMRN